MTTGDHSAALTTCAQCERPVTVAVVLVHRPGRGRPISWSLCRACWSPSPSFATTKKPVKIEKGKLL